MTDDANQKYPNQRNREPRTIDTDVTGTNATGNYLGGATAAQGNLPDPNKSRDIWIEQEDHAKQGMARKVDTKGAQAAPGHPHVGHQAGSGEIQ